MRGIQIQDAKPMGRVGKWQEKVFKSFVSADKAFFFRTMMCSRLGQVLRQLGRGGRVRRLEVFPIEWLLSQDES